MSLPLVGQCELFIHNHDVLQSIYLSVCPRVCLVGCAVVCRGMCKEDPSDPLVKVCENFCEGKGLVTCHCEGGCGLRFGRQLWHACGCGQIHLIKYLVC